ncbi:unnamed protein product [Leuciscus chuanchicus]
MAAKPINGLGGRKRRDDLWTYFQYNPSERKTECIVLGDDGKCGHELGGTTNLKRHLKAHHADIFSKGSSFKDLASLAIKMKSNMDKRFSCFLDHTDSKFSPLAAAECFLDPTVAPEALLENEDEQTEALLRRSEDYIAQLVPPVVREEEAEDVMGNK